MAQLERARTWTSFYMATVRMWCCGQCGCLNLLLDFTQVAPKETAAVVSGNKLAEKEDEEPGNEEYEEVEDEEDYEIVIEAGKNSGPTASDMNKYRAGGAICHF